jgi:Tfp pilus assembly protein PilF
MNRVIAAVLLLGMSSTFAFGQGDSPALSDQYFLDRGTEAAGIGDLDAAAQYYQSAIIYKPTNPVAYHRLGQLYAKNGQRELAQQYFALALNVEPAFAPALEGLALLDLAAGNRAGAEAQRDILLRACGATCPETAQVERALTAAKGTPAN